MFRLVFLCWLTFVLAQPDADMEDMEEKCDDCGNHVEDCLDRLKEPMQKAEPVTIENFNNCEICNISDLYTVKKDGRICPQRQQDGSNMQLMELAFDNIHGHCICSFIRSDGAETKGDVYIDWPNPRVRCGFHIKDGKAAVVDAMLNCVNPLPKCLVPFGDLKIECEGSEDFVRECKEKSNSLTDVMSNAAEVTFPAAAVDIINKHPEFVKQMNCEDE